MSKNIVLKYVSIQRVFTYYALCQMHICFFVYKIRNKIWRSEKMADMACLIAFIITDVCNFDHFEKELMKLITIKSYLFN